MADAPMAGFPPPPESVVTLGNWQEPPFNRWSFQHLREIVPTQRIARGARAKPLARSDNPAGARPHRRDAARRRSVHRRGGAGGHVDRRRHRAARRPDRPRTLLRSDAGQHASPADVGLEVHRGMRLRNPRRPGAAWTPRRRSRSTFRRSPAPVTTGPPCDTCSTCAPASRSARRTRTPTQRCA